LYEDTILEKKEKVRNLWIISIYTYPGLKSKRIMKMANYLLFMNVYNFQGRPLLFLAVGGMVYLI